MNDDDKHKSGPVVVDDSALLLVVDMQLGLINRHTEHLVPAIERVQRAFPRVLFTRFYNPDPSPFRRFLNYDKFARNGPEFPLAVLPRPDAEIFDKPSYTCLACGVDEYIERAEPSAVFLCGISTEACVLKTAADLFERGVRCYLLEDLCGSDKGPEFHHMAVRLISELIGRHHIISLERLTFPAVATAGERA
ncbi:MAG: cysteine hydrolase [Alphaproteobacteria bacterium]|nr:cysteine hydrolase [Alphaproteobacteria bacterium]